MRTSKGTCWPDTKKTFSVKGTGNIKKERKGILGLNRRQEDEQELFLGCMDRLVDNQAHRFLRMSGNL